MTDKSLEKFFFPEANLTYRPSIQDVEEFEQENKVSLPDDFKCLLLNWGRYIAKSTYNDLDIRVVYPLTVRKFGKNFLNVVQSSRFGGVFKSFDDTDSFDLPKFSLLFEESDGASIFMTLWPGAEGQIFYMENDYYEEDNDTLAIGDYDPDDAIEDFDPANNVIPYYFTKLADSFSEFVGKLKLINEDSLERAEELRKKGEQLDWSKIIEY